MFERPFWIRRIREAWSSAPVAWLAGVRRVGKTTLALSLGSDEAEYVSCDLPEDAERTRDPLLFFRECRKPAVILDEIHYLDDPSRLLKIGADRFPRLRILATGSSTLAATRKFRDSLAGRRRTVRLTPVLVEELDGFGNVSLERRLHHGGLPQALLSSDRDPGFYREWIDAFFARDLQRLFGLRDINKFSTLFEYLMRQSGGLFEPSKVSREVGVGRPTVASHVLAMETTHALTLVRPFFGGGSKEITKMPKCYGFDTGFVSFCRGWTPLRREDMGLLWEHVVLESLQACLPYESILYWRDTAGREVDFIVARGRDKVDAVECKWSPSDLDPAALIALRSRYPAGRNYLVCPSVERPSTRRFKSLEVFACGLKALVEALAGARGKPPGEPADRKGRPA